MRDPASSRRPRGAPPEEHDRRTRPPDSNRSASGRTERPPPAAGGAIALDRVCVVMMSAIGDAVHVLPVVTALKRRRPGCRITWVLQPGPASLVRGHPAVDEIVTFDKARGWRALLDVRRALAGRRFDLVLDLQVYIKAGLVTALARAPMKLGFDRARARAASAR